MDRQEREVLRLIKIVPIFLTVIFFITILFVVINSKIQAGRQDIKDLKESYLQRKKSRVKNEVLSLVGHINYERSFAENNLKKELKERVDAAYAIAMNIYMKNRDKDKKVIVSMIKDALRPIRYRQGRGYFFIYDMNLKNVLLPIMPEAEGVDFTNYRDVHGDYVVKNIARLCKKNGSTFYTWYWVKPNDKHKNYKKIGYSRYFKPLDWFIGTGEYVVDFEKTLQKKIIRRIQDMRYEKSNYFFTITYDGIVLTHIKRSYIGTNCIDMKDREGISFVKRIIELAKKGGGFIRYKATMNPNSKKLSEKISYVAAIDKWGWVIGSGEYLDDIQSAVSKKEKELKIQMRDTVLKWIVVFFIIAIMLGFVLFFITKKSEEIFLKYKQAILKETQKSKKQLLLIQNQNKLASMGEMLGNISHQWKQPLNTLGISISKMLLLEEDGRLTKDIMLKSFARMEKNIEYLSETIDVFRDFFRPSQEIENFNLKIEIENVVYIAQDSFEHDMIDISCVCESDIFMSGDKKKFEQVLLNILNNAKDAIILNRIKNGRVTIKAEKFKDFVKITIQDNALGVPKKIEDKIFEPYFTTKAKFKGTGVGLYMSKFIIENSFQGELSFENANGGAKFTIVIPLN